MRKRMFGLTLAVCFLSGAMTTAHAGGISGLFNTGVASSGIPLPDQTVGDPHYSLVSVPGGTTDIQVRTAAGGFPIPPWIGDDTRSAWITPSGNVVDNGPAGNYDYQTTFNVAAADVGIAEIAGRWATDNFGLDILINGNSTGAFAASFSDWTPFSINSGFVAGTNTLDFIVFNQEQGATGLRVEMTSVPEPGSMLVLGLGLSTVVGAAWLKRRKKNIAMV